MSHAATNWAIQQRGLPPATKLVLWHLCDRHNPDFGCFPSQAQLAEDAEVSRSQLNVHLQRLEAAGLIRRVQRVDEATNRQQSTRYILGFEKGFAQAPSLETGHGSPGTEIEQPALPSPETGHGYEGEPSPVLGPSRVRKPDTNPVREPVREEEERASAPISSDDWERIISAVLQDADCVEIPRWWQGDGAKAHVAGWIADGLSVDEVILEIRSFVARIPDPPEGPKALDMTMSRAVRAKRKAPAKAQPADRASFLALIADWVNGDKYLPGSAVTPSLGRELIEAGLITKERARARGVVV